MINEIRVHIYMTRLRWYMRRYLYCVGRAAKCKVNGDLKQASFWANRSTRYLDKVFMMIDAIYERVVL